MKSEYAKLQGRLHRSPDTRVDTGKLSKSCSGVGGGVCEARESLNKGTEA